MLDKDELLKKLNIIYPDITLTLSSFFTAATPFLTNATNESLILLNTITGLVPIFSYYKKQELDQKEMKHQTENNKKQEQILLEEMNKELNTKKIEYLFAGQEVIKPYRSTKQKQDLTAKELNIVKNFRIKSSIRKSIATATVALSLGNILVNLEPFADNIYRQATYSYIKENALDGEQVTFLNRYESYNNEEIIDTISSAIEFNQYVDKNDKEEMTHLYQYLTDNQFLKLNELCAEWSILKIDNHYDSSFTTDFNGSYLRDDHLINIYEENDRKSTLFHELIHTTGYLDNKALNEGMTELLSAEYFQDAMLTTYHSEVFFVQAMIDTFGADTMLEAFSTRNMDVLLNKMYEVNPDKEMADQLLNNMEKYSIMKWDEKASEEELFIQQQKIHGPLLTYAKARGEEVLSRVETWYDMVETEFPTIGRFNYNQKVLEEVKKDYDGKTDDIVIRNNRYSSTDTNYGRSK